MSHSRAEQATIRSVQIRSTAFMALSTTSLVLLVVLLVPFVLGAVPSWSPESAMRRRARSVPFSSSS